jgi:hypothetical protein
MDDPSPSCGRHVGNAGASSIEQPLNHAMNGWLIEHLVRTYDALNPGAASALLPLRREQGDRIDARLPHDGPQLAHFAERRPTGQSSAHRAGGPI